MRRPLVVALVIAVGYAGAILLHRRCDRVRPEPAPVTRTAELDGIWRRLARSDAAGVALLRDELEATGGAARELLDLLPAADEPWRATVAALARGDEPASPTGDAGPRFVMPRGAQASGRPIVRIEGVAGPSALELVRIDAEAPVRGFVARPGEDLVLLGEDALPAASSWRLDLRDEAGTTLASTVFQVLDEGERARQRELLARLKRGIASPRARAYAQAVLAMSAGLHDDAARILLDAWPDPDAAERDVAARRAFLLHRRGRTEDARRLLR